jgi:hypothetical protein
MKNSRNEAVAFAAQAAPVRPIGTETLESPAPLPSLRPAGLEPFAFQVPPLPVIPWSRSVVLTNEL